MRRSIGWMRFLTSIVSALLIAALLTSGESQAAIIANSQADWSATGVQGANGWTQGYYVATGDATPGFQANEFISFPTTGAFPRYGFLTSGNRWDWLSSATVAPSSSPWTEVGVNAVHPNGSNQPVAQGAQWAMRRYVVEASDVPAGTDAAILWRMRKSTAAGSGNAGVTGRVFLNGVEIDSAAIPFNDLVGVHRSMYVPGLQAGDIIDFAYTAEGPGGLDTADGSDGGNNWLKIRSGATPFTPYSAAPVPTYTRFVNLPAHADSVAEFSGTQGQGNWNYGYFLQQATSDPASIDPDGYQSYDFIPFPSGTPGAGNAGFGFIGGAWDYIGTNGVAANPSWTFINSTNMHPNGVNNVNRGASQTNVPAGTVYGVQWPVRRWVSEVDGPVSVYGMLNRPAVGPQNTIGRIYHNDVEVYNQATAGNSIGYDFNLVVAQGDTIDFVLDAGTGQNDGSDDTRFTGIIAPTLDVLLMADSVADFSNDQGHRGWSYGYWNRRQDENVDADGDGIYAPDEFVEFAPEQFQGGSWDLAVNVAPWTQLTSTGGHPAANAQGNPEVHWAVRRWESSYDTVVRLDGMFAKQSASGDGIVARIYVDGFEVYRQLVTTTAGNHFSLHVPVEVGSTIDFVIDAGPFDADGSDGTNFNVKIYRAVPEPSTFVLLITGAIAVGASRRRRANR